MKTFALLLLAALTFSLAACSTAAKKDCCSTGGSCSAESGKHKH